MRDKDQDDKGTFIYRTTIKLKDGRILYARQYGIKAFRIPVSELVKKA